MNKLTRFLVPLLLIVLIIGSIGWYLFVYDRDFTRDMLLQQARFHDLHGNPRLSSWFYQLAYEHSGQDENVAIELANQYKADGNFTKAEYTLTNAINDGPTAELYTALCKTFVEQDKLLDAVNMLANISNPEIKATLDAQRPSAPTANYEPGFYNQYIEVELRSSSSTDTLYYSTEGEYPSTGDPAFSSPIALGSGETVIHTISVSESGLVSPVSILGYTVGGVIEPAIFMDAKMEAAIRSTINADENDVLYTDELWEITEFTIPEGTGSLEDLKLLPFLRSLSIQNYNVSGLEHLSALTRLETLEFVGCRFDNTEMLSVIVSLPNLTSLTLSDCGLSTVADLAGMQKLQYLDLSSNGGLRDLSVLSDMVTLKELYLQHNAVISVEQLSTLTNLEKLDISYNAINTLYKLNNCAKLRTLNADGNQLIDADGIKNLGVLESISLNYNRITNVVALGSCPELKEISINNNEIKDLSPLERLLKLEVLDFSYNSVSEIPYMQEGCALRTVNGSYNMIQSIDALARAKNICYVYMDYNNLRNVDALADCYNLVQLNVFGNDIDDVSKLTDHDIIVNYDPT